MGTAVRRCAPPANMVCVCTQCRASSTPQWRSGSQGQTLCNACGLRRRIGDRSGSGDGLYLSATRTGILRSRPHRGGVRQSPRRVGRVGQVHKNDNSRHSTSSSRQLAASRSMLPACKPPPSDTTSSGASSEPPHTARMTAATASPALTTPPAGVARSLLGTGEMSGRATFLSARRDEVSAVPAPATPSTNVQCGPSGSLPRNGARKDAAKARAARDSDEKLEASAGSGGALATGTLAAVGMAAAEATQSHCPTVGRSMLRPDATTEVASFADRAAAVIALTRRAAMSGLLFPASSRHTAFPRSSAMMTPTDGAPLPLAVPGTLPSSGAPVHRAPGAHARRPLELSSPGVCSASPLFPEVGHQATAAACRGGILGPHASATRPLRPAHRAGANRPLLRDVCLHRSSSAADDFAGAPSADDFRLFTPYEVGSAVASFAGAQVSPGRQVELTNALTMGAIEGNIVGIVAVEEDVNLVTAALMSFCPRTHRGKLPYATECRVKRFLWRMR